MTTHQEDILRRAAEVVEDVCQHWEGRPIETPESEAKSLSLALADAINNAKATKGETMPEAIKPGDVVRLKTGGPKMTVEDLVQPPAQYNAGLAQSYGMPVSVRTYRRPVGCVWFDGNAGPYRQTFEEDALEEVSA
jgi:uncharacterized protein YodC (DUF2158 family)